YKSYVPNMDEGWTRWILERFEFPYTSLLNRDIQAGRLLEKFDAIILPDATARTLELGFAAGEDRRSGAFGPMPPEFSGRLRDARAAALKEFANGGGTILAFNRASLYAVQQLGAGARNVLSGVPIRDFYAPGSLFNATVDPGPLTFGMDKQVAVWFES